MMNKKYLDKVLEHLVRGTQIDYENNSIAFPFTNLSISNTTPPFYSFSYFRLFPSETFNSNCRNTFGLTEDEIDYVWKEYKKIILEKLENGK